MISPDFIDDLAERFREHDCQFVIGWGDADSPCTHVVTNLHEPDAHPRGWDMMVRAIGECEAIGADRDAPIPDAAAMDRAVASQLAIRLSQILHTAGARAMHLGVEIAGQTYAVTVEEEA